VARAIMASALYRPLSLRGGGGESAQEEILGPASVVRGAGSGLKYGFRLGLVPPLMLRLAASHAISMGLSVPFALSLHLIAWASCFFLLFSGIALRLLGISCISFVMGDAERWVTAGRGAGRG